MGIPSSVGAIHSLAILGNLSRTKGVEGLARSEDCGVSLEAEFQTPPIVRLDGLHC